MTQLSPMPIHRKTILTVGIGLIAIALLFLVGFGVWLVGRGNLFGSAVAADAILFIDVPGRIAIDGTLQIDGPAPVPVAVGTHQLTFFDISSQSPVEVSVKQDEFQYVPDPTAPSSYRTATSYGIVQAAAFPPNTTIEIPDCTPVDSKYSVTCKSNHTLQAELSPGSYTIKYNNPHLGEHQENITVGSGSVTRRPYSFITTVDQWDAWRQEHGDVIEQTYPRYGRSGGGSGLLLPLEVTGEVLDDLFN